MAIEYHISARRACTNPAFFLEKNDIFRADIANFGAGLADAAAEPSLESAVQVLKKEFKRFETVNMLSAASRTGTLEELATLFQQVQELLQLNPDENETALLRPSQNAALPETVNEIFDIRALRQAGSYEELLRELALAFARMEAKNYRPRQRAQLCELAWKLLFEGKTPPEDALAAWADALTAAWSLPQPDARSREIFLAIYENLSDPQYDTPEKRGALISRLIREQYALVKQNAPMPTCWTTSPSCGRPAAATPRGTALPMHKTTTVSPIALQWQSVWQATPTTPCSTANTRTTTPVTSSTTMCPGC